jgi:hypothetical protein
MTVATNLENECEDEVTAIWTNSSDGRMKKRIRNFGIDKYVKNGFKGDEKQTVVDW